MADLPGALTPLDPEARPLIQIQGIAKRFGDITAVDHVDLEIYKGELFSILGGSGSGKTTLLRMLGGLRQDEGVLEKSVAAYRAALTVRTRERAPEDWATTQNDLGAALPALGEHTGDLLTLGRAVSAYRESMKELNREREPMAWAMTMANLGVARRKLAERSRDAAVARRAAADIEAAVDVFRDASHPELSHLGLAAEPAVDQLVALLGELDPDLKNGARSSLKKIAKAAGETKGERAAEGAELKARIEKALAEN